MNPVKANLDSLLREGWSVVTAIGSYCVAFRGGIEAVWEWFEENGCGYWQAVSVRKNG